MQVKVFPPITRRKVHTESFYLENMKLNCKVQISNRLTAFTNIGNRKFQRSCLAVGRQSIKSDEIHLLLQTPSNKNGTKYKVSFEIFKSTINIFYK